MRNRIDERGVAACGCSHKAVAELKFKPGTFRIPTVLFNMPRRFVVDEDDNG
jgi:hypothetical protein